MVLLSAPECFTVLQCFTVLPSSGLFEAKPSTVACGLEVPRNVMPLRLLSTNVELTNCEGAPSLSKHIVIRSKALVETRVSGQAPRSAAKSPRRYVQSCIVFVGSGIRDFM